MAMDFNDDRLARFLESQPPFRRIVATENTKQTTMLMTPEMIERIDNFKRTKGWKKQDIVESALYLFFEYMDFMEQEKKALL